MKTDWIFCMLASALLIGMVSPVHSLGNSVFARGLADAEWRVRDATAGTAFLSPSNGPVHLRSCQERTAR